MEYMQYIIIIVVLLIIALAITKSKRKDFRLEANKLVVYLGGKDNIITYEFNKSRFIVTLKDVTLANKEGIQRLGAQGIVEIDNQLKIILGENAKQIKKHIDELKWFYSLFFIIWQSSTLKKCIFMSRGERNEYIWNHSY